jgi:hypothetical protein
MAHLELIADEQAELINGGRRYTFNKIELPALTSNNGVIANQVYGGVSVFNGPLLTIAV